MPKKHQYSFIKGEFEKCGYVLLSTEYINNASPLRYICPYGHKHTVRYNDWRKGVRCPECCSRNTYGLRYRVEEVKKRYALEGYVLLSDSFKNIRSTVKVRCPNGHIFEQAICSWTAGNRCPYCSNRVRLLNRVDEISEILNKEGYVFKGFVERKVKYVCPSGHRHAVLWTDWQRGVRCPYCNGNARKSIDEIKVEFESEDYILLSDNYENCYTKLLYICPKGHQGSVTWNDWQQGCRCRVCAYKLTSKRFSGSGHPNWMGGISKEPYCVDWTKEYKEYIKERDGNTCLNPYCFSKNPNDLVVHHIDYNKKNCDQSNLITLCRVCNNMANKDRGWHEYWYKAIIYRRFL